MDEDILYACLTFAMGMTTVLTTARIVLRWLDTRRRPLEHSPILDERLARIEQIVDATSIEVERIAEGQRFTTKLLTERGASVPVSSRHPERSITPH
jgi:hypothetical protein